MAEKETNGHSAQGFLTLAADLHTHTIASGHAFSTVTEMAAAAAERGLEMLGIADHGPAMPGGPHRYHFGNLRNLPPRICGVEVIRGVEANILDTSGRLDLPDYYLRNLDMVLAGLHFVCFPQKSREDNTSAVLAAMDNPHVDAIVHPGNPEYKLDYEAVVRKAASKGILLEVNNSSLGGKARTGSAGNCQSIVCLIRDLGGTILVSSDAHFCTQVGVFDEALKLLASEGIRAEQVLNTSGAKIRQFLAGRGKKRYAIKEVPPSE